MRCVYSLREEAPGYDVWYDVWYDVCGRRAPATRHGFTGEGGGQELAFQTPLSFILCQYSSLIEKKKKRRKISKWVVEGRRSHFGSTATNVSAEV